jgi:hypothetical protein
MWSEENDYSVDEETPIIITDCLDRLSDSKLIDRIINEGAKLNAVTEFFPAYDVAVKLKENGWTPTKKQRQALINVYAWYLWHLDMRWGSERI